MHTDPHIIRPAPEHVGVHTPPEHAMPLEQVPHVKQPDGDAPHVLPAQSFATIGCVHAPPPQTSRVQAEPSSRQATPSETEMQLPPEHV